MPTEYPTSLANTTIARSTKSSLLTSTLNNIRLTENPTMSTSPLPGNIVLAYKSATPLSHRPNVVSNMSLNFDAVRLAENPLSSTTGQVSGLKTKLASAALKADASRPLTLTLETSGVHLARAANNSLLSNKDNSAVLEQQHHQQQQQEEEQQEDVEIFRQALTRILLLERQTGKMRKQADALMADFQALDERSRRLQSEVKVVAGEAAKLCRHQQQQQQQQEAGYDNKHLSLEHITELLRSVGGDSTVIIPYPVQLIKVKDKGTSSSSWLDWCRCGCRRSRSPNDL